MKTKTKKTRITKKFIDKLINIRGYSTISLDDDESIVDLKSKDIDRDMCICLYKKLSYKGVDLLIKLVFFKFEYDADFRDTDVEVDVIPADNDLHDSSENYILVKYEEHLLKQYLKLAEDTRNESI